MRVLVAVFFTLCIACFGVAATDGAGNYAVWGKGKQSCFSYSRARQDDDIRDYKNYTMGYLTATNIMMEQTYSISGKMHLDEIFQWMDEYCQDNPMSSYEGALTEFALSHFEARSKSSSSASW